MKYELENFSEAVDQVDKTDNFDPRLLAYPAGGLMAAYGIHSMNKSVPGGISRMTADYARNFLPGFYSGKFGAQVGAFGKEAIKTAGRISQAALNPIESITYRNTGVSNLVPAWIKEREMKIKQAKQAYIDGTPTWTNQEGKNVKITSRQHLRQVIRNQEKMVHFKLTSDYANQFVFGGETKRNFIKDYGKDIVTKSNYTRFKKDVGVSNKIAEYILGRQGVKSSGTVLLHYKNTPWADVLRGAQFDPRMYDAMLNLQTIKHKSIDDIASILASKGAKNIAINKKAGEIAFEIAGVKMKPHYDWGGYNAVAIWDKNHPDHIRIAATDKRDLFGMRAGGKNAVNYVTSKRIKIPEFVEKFKQEVDKGPEVKRPYNYSDDVIKNRRLARQNWVNSPEADEWLRLQKGKVSKQVDQVALKRQQYQTGIYSNFRKYGPRFLKALMRRSAIIGGAGLIASMAYNDWYEPKR